MAKIFPDFLGMTVDEAKLTAEEMQIDGQLIFKEYNPAFYKCWGKQPVFEKRVVRQKILTSGVLEMLVSDFIVQP